MATTILMPQQGQSVEACTIVRWLMQPGDTVRAGDVVCEIETDKAAFEVESTTAGTLLAQFAAAGEEVPVLTPIAAVGKPDEVVAAPPPPAAPGGASIATFTSAAAADRRGAAPAPAALTGVISEAGGVRNPRAASAPKDVPAPAAASTRAPHHHVPSCTTRPVGPTSDQAVTVNGGRAGAGDDHSKPAISPRARRRATALGVDYRGLTGSGPRGRILERDVVAAASEQAASAPPPIAPPPVERIPITGVRKRISERLRRSLLDTAQLTLHGSADAEVLIAFRARLKGSVGQPQLRTITINDLILYAVARTLPAFPQLNAVVEDGTPQHVVRHRGVQLAFAVDTARGLLVPVIAGAHQLPLAVLADRAHELAAAAQAGSISPDRLQGGTFTVTNLGAFGVERFTPILNPPQVAILGVGALTLQPVLTGEAQEVAAPAAAAATAVSYRRHLGLSLTIDHRVVDGAPAARLLQALAAAIAEIDLLAAIQHERPRA